MSQDVLPEDATHVVEYERIPDGRLRYWWTRTQHSRSCPNCRAGVCIQRVTRCDTWLSDSVWHTTLADLH